ncbi:GrlR family regulatory protein [Rhodopseudomonas sp. B29]|uniref:GrlR family regulatory protein n=1 Tax=Rhodopseudomonas sp. B29 TaxID=95607 RepID=UPI000345B6B2|nr:GrlR family regulatory protein [Rhodopseudomonas sp. B29]
MQNGLYSIHVDLLDGRSGKGSGVVLFRDGRILGGDAYLFYVGSYTVTGDAFRGEVTITQHTPSPDANPLFGGQREPVGVGVTGTSTGGSAVMQGTALVGKSSQLFRATLRRLADAD